MISKNISRNHFLYSVAATLALTLYGLAIAKTDSLDRTIAQRIDNQPKVEIEEEYQIMPFIKKDLKQISDDYEKSVDFPKNPSFDKELEKEIQASEEATLSQR